ncbi:hypothetical protein AAHW25_10470 [Klebsiella pneumoniae]|jgi:hypothetical protein|uniref:hypothetical protein n=1 Tax=Klebsiella pneumoniae TaxID=573 RepID=UPI000B9550C8|nr:hypothetical protein [Klebsiella pneumoniae]MCT4358218.1 hypothetical protein [Klebsiella pneumoniae]MDA3142438.1 hypothetical protein [Klebsiella pneumoniae]OYI97719.1 hypothetical protein CI741_15880 [Klebsiella pneumoniae subsp. pneumoniae]VVJ35077.1 Uncharacterised protein [Klebsiella pneumoniae]HBX7755868.1 hypothetical protein [Klebsiella pneumoniae]
MKKVLLAFLPLMLTGCVNPVNQAPAYNPTPVVQPEEAPLVTITPDQVKKLTNEYLAYCNVTPYTFLGKEQLASDKEACDKETKYRLKHKKLTKAEEQKNESYAKEMDDFDQKLKEQGQKSLKALEACNENPIICRIHMTDKELDEGGM